VTGAPALPHPPILPYLTVSDGRGAIDFYAAAFGAEVIGDVLAMSDGKVGNASLRAGDAVFMLSDAFPDGGVPSPDDLGGTTVAISMYVADCDAAVERAVAAGATLQMEPEDRFWGNRDAWVIDPYGHRWNLAQRIEDLTIEEMGRRAAAFEAEMGDQSDG
jgi:PhnB protein